MSEKTKQKISRKLTGRKKTAAHSKHISEGMRRYWAAVPEGNNEDNE